MARSKQSTGRGGRGRGAGRGGGRNAGASQATATATVLKPVPKKRAAGKAAATPTGAGKTRERDQANRRDIKLQVQRATESPRLSHIPKAVWTSVTNAEGVGVEEYIANHIVEKRSSGGRLGSRFWAQLFKEFSFDVPLIIPKPKDEERPDPALAEALEIIRHDNPVTQSAAAVVSYLDHARSLSEGQVYGFLRAVHPGQVVPHMLAQRAHMALLRFWGRTGEVGDRPLLRFRA